MPEQRKLAAIMFTDIVGYTSLMAKDEHKALCCLKKHRDITKCLVSRFKGEWLKEMGDGTLSSFGSVINAVNCALEIQNSLREIKGFKLRIGIHIGDVVVEDGDVFGDGVNVASRIESLAEPGGICISERVYYDIQNKPNLKAVLLGEKTLKNVACPIKVYSITGKGTPASRKKSGPAGKPETIMAQPSIAVLPFINMSDDTEQEYFCDGMTEEIINALAHVDDLHVVARTSAFYFKDEKYDIREIGNKLNVESVLEGSVRKAGNRLRITAQLINITDGFHLWSEKYDRDMEDIFAIQDEISLTIVKELKGRLLPGEKAAIKKQYTTNTESYNLYLLGRYHWNKRTEKDLGKAIGYFQQALEKDPNYALAYIGLADLFNFLGLYGFMPPHDAFQKAKAAVGEALRLDDTIAEAHAALAFVSFHYDWDWPVAEREFKRCIELNPNYAMAHHYYAKSLTGMGLFDEAMLEIKKAQELEPLSIPISADVALPLYFGRKFDEAFEQCMITKEMDPNYPTTYWYLGMIYRAKSMWEDALEASQKLVSLTGNWPLALGFLGCNYAASGQRDEALKVLDTMNGLSKETHVSSFWKAIIYAGFGEKDTVFDYLEKAFMEREPFMVYINNATFDLISDDPRFNALWEKIGLSE